MSNEFETKCFSINKSWEQVKQIKLEYLFENDIDANTYIKNRMEQLAVDALTRHGMYEPIDSKIILPMFMDKVMPWVLNDPMCPITEIRLQTGVQFDTFNHIIYILYKSVWNPFDYMKISISIGS